MALTQSTAQGQSYTVIDLGTLGGQTSAANGINRNTQVVGVADTSAGSHAFRWDRHTGMTDLGSLGSPDTGLDFAFGINRSGQVVGQAATIATYYYFQFGGLHPFSGGTVHGFLWDGASGMLDLGTLGPGFVHDSTGQYLASSVANAINDNGQVAGTTYSYEFAPSAVAQYNSAFLYQDGAMQALGVFAGGTQSWADGINSAGQVVGFSDGQDPGGAFLWTAGGTDGDPSNPQMLNLGTLGGPSSGAGAINDSEHVVGASDPDLTSPQVAFLWTRSAGMRSLGFPPGKSWSDANAINNNDQVVGVAQTFDPDLGYLQDLVATVWDSAHGMRDLNTLIPTGTGWVLQEAKGINDNGEIVGTGTLNGVQRGFLLRPLSTATPPGAAVTVTPTPGVSLDFSSVLIGGTTTITTAPGAPPVPSGFQVQAGTFIDIATTATPGGAVDVCVSYDPSVYARDPSYPNNVRLLHYDTSAGAWVDITSSVNPDSHIVCGLTSSFSPFVVAGKLSADIIPPTITISTPAIGAVYTLNQSVAASYAATDTGSGVAAVKGDVPNGGNIGTAAVGIRTFTVHATDNAGNTTSVTSSYSVAFAFSPLYDQTRAVRSGAVLPVKLYLGDAHGADVSSSATTVHAVGVARISTNAPGALEDAGNANPDNNFRFDATLGPTGGYIFNLSTRGYATGTYSLSFTAGADPTVHVVQFQVK
jgi:probable HAF family extracellular repeat protein